MKEKSKLLTQAVMILEFTATLQGVINLIYLIYLDLMSAGALSALYILCVIWSL